MRELDKRIAVEIFGWKLVEAITGCYGFPPDDSEHVTYVPCYETDHFDCLKLINHLRNKGISVAFSTHLTDKWKCIISRTGNEAFTSINYGDSISESVAKTVGFMIITGIKL